MTTNWIKSIGKEEMIASDATSEDPDGPTTSVVRSPTSQRQALTAMPVIQGTQKISHIEWILAANHMYM